MLVTLEDNLRAILASSAVWRNDTERLWSLSETLGLEGAQKFRYPACSNRLRKVKSLQLGAAETRHRGFQFILDAFGNYLHPERAAEPDLIAANRRLLEEIRFMQRSAGDRSKFSETGSKSSRDTSTRGSVVD